MLHRENRTHVPERAQGTDEAELRFSKKPHFQATIHAILIYNWAFWLALTKYFPEGGGGEGEVTRKVISIALSAWSRTRKGSWKQPQKTSIYYHHISQTNRLGSTKNRTKEQKERARRVAEEAIEKVPAQDAIVFTDGSGPVNMEGCAGAAAVVLMPRHRATGVGECLMASQAFEEGTNNTAEMWAVGMGIQLIAFDVRRSGVGLRGRIHIFSDSALTVDIIAHRAVPRKNTALCHAVRREANTVNIHNHIVMHWVAGHVGVQGNEIADRGADKAKKRASKGFGIDLNEYEYRIRQSLFLPTRGQQEDYEYHWMPP